MKKLIACVCVLLMLVTVLTACGSNGDPAGTMAVIQVTPDPTPQPTAAPDDVVATTDYKTEQWVAVDIPFEATTTIKNIDEVEFDVVFVNSETGTTLVMPGFWNGGNEWIVRFAPTECGVWNYETKTKGKTDIGLNGVKGTLAANAYKGDLAIYQHGFLKATKPTRYFTHADGTPFFYLGDTHWNMLAEEYDSKGTNAGNIETDSHFKYIVDRRVAQHFTVYQSEPIGARYDTSNGITNADIPGFTHADPYFKYIAQSGLVHANAMLLFPSSVNARFQDEEFVYHLTRYWIARYAAYPVVWTLGQEVDPDGYSGVKDGDKNPFITMCEQIEALDPYDHPCTAHQMNAVAVGAFGGVVSYSSYAGENPSKRVNVRSAFYGMTEHDWWGVQWRPEIGRQTDFAIPKGYWIMGEEKVAINYEARYEYLYTKEFGNRVAGWTSFLCGMYGYGYGVADMWLYKGNYTFDSDSSDGFETVTMAEKPIKWSETVFLPSGDQMTYMRGFLEAAGWWKLIPRFDEGVYYQDVDIQKDFYVCATDENNVYVVYLYSKSVTAGGNLANMDKDATYTAQWFNPRTGIYTLIDAKVVPTEHDGTYVYSVPDKPEADDMVLLVTKN